MKTRINSQTAFAFKLIKFFCGYEPLLLMFVVSFFMCHAKKRNNHNSDEGKMFSLQANSKKFYEFLKLLHGRIFVSARDTLNRKAILNDSS